MAKADSWVKLLARCMLWARTGYFYTRMVDSAISVHDTSVSPSAAVWYVPSAHAEQVRSFVVSSAEIFSPILHVFVSLVHAVTLDSTLA